MNFLENFQIRKYDINLINKEDTQLAINDFSFPLITRIDNMNYIINSQIKSDFILFCDNKFKNINDFLKQLVKFILKSNNELKTKIDLFYILNRYNIDKDEINNLINNEMIAKIFTSLSRENSKFITNLKLRKKEFKSFCNAYDITKGKLENLITISRLCQMNRNTSNDLFTNYYEALYKEIISLEDIDNDLLNIATNVQYNKNVKQLKIKQFLRKLLNPGYNSKEKEFNSFVNKNDLKLIKIQHPDFFEEKGFEINCKITNKKNLEKFKDELNSLIKCVDDLWENF